LFSLENGEIKLVVEKIINENVDNFFRKENYLFNKVCKFYSNNDFFDECLVKKTMNNLLNRLKIDTNNYQTKTFKKINRW